MGSVSLIALHGAPASAGSLLGSLTSTVNTTTNAVTTTVAPVTTAVTTAVAPVTTALTSTTDLTSVHPLYGNISAFYGNVSAFYGNVSAFYGNISAFYGNISAFYGPLSPFYGNVSAFSGNQTPFTAATDSATVGFYGTTNDPFWGSGKSNPYTNNPSKYVNYSQIRGFWVGESQNWMALQNAWSVAKTSADYQAVATQLQNTILNPASSFWGAAVSGGNKSVNFYTGFANAALAKAGVSINNGVIDPTSLQNLTPSDQAMLFLNFYDGLMSYSGTGHVDWWMGATGWSPALAATAGSLYNGAQPVTVGMLDFTVTNNTKNAKGTLSQYGSSQFSNGHGAAVGSLIMGSIDGSGIMGVLPAAATNVIAYDPYDSTGTTNWTDIQTGLQVLAGATFAKQGAPVGVLNASLGVPGWTLNPGWNTALSTGAGLGHNLVIAAGNDGSTQTTNVAWNFAINPVILVVGSVGVDGTISNFSNRPGESCLIDTLALSDACVEANKLKYRFITAPGELILVSDGNGGVTRQTGTSLAAPLVSGAIALLQARWPWLANFPQETANIILKTATPKGTNPGADPVYGVGELNIAASQSPLDWSKLLYFPVSNGQVLTTPILLSSVVGQVKGGNQASWNASKLSFYALETVGGTVRDFEIPLASSLVGQTVTTGGGTQLFQSYLATGLKSWVNAGAQFSADGAARPFGLGFSQTPGGIAMGQVAGMDLQLNMAPRETTFGFKSTGPYNTEFALAGKNQTVHFGFGNGAAALNGESGFNQRSDFQTERGGANPLLGLASGGAFADFRVGVTKRLAISAGVTQRHDIRDLGVFGVANQDSAVRAYDASAAHVGLDFAVSNGLVLHTSMTKLREAQGLLGVQSLSPGDLGHGSTTTGTTVGFDLALPADLTLSASGTLAKTTTAAGEAFSTGPGGLNSSAGEVALTRAGLFSGDDRLRLTLSKSMQVDSGAIHYSAYGVVNRQTGALGVIDQTVDPSTGRVPAAVEMLYGRLMPDHGSEVSLFVRAGTNTSVQATTDGPINYMAGAQYKVRF